MRGVSTAEQVAAWKQAHADEFIKGCPISPTMTRESCHMRRARVYFQPEAWKQRNRSRANGWEGIGYDSQWSTPCNPAGCVGCTAWRDDG